MIEFQAGHFPPPQLSRLFVSANWGAENQAARLPRPLLGAFLPISALLSAAGKKLFWNMIFFTLKLLWFQNLKKTVGGKLALVVGDSDFIVTVFV